MFDLDGTLLRGSSASLEIARANALEARLEAAEKTFADGLTTERDFARLIWPLFSGLHPDDVRRAFDAAPWIEDIDRTLAAIHQGGGRAMVVTLSPGFFADLLLDVGFDVVAASSFPSLGGAPAEVLEDVSGILMAADKVYAVDDEVRRLGLSRDQCIAYGDSLSDQPLFATLRRTVAVNATPALRAIAAITYDGDSLLEAWTRGRDLEWGAIARPQDGA